MIKEMKPGDLVYHIDRDEDEYPLEACGTVYIAAVGNYVISIASPCGRDDINEVMKYLAEMTRNNFNSDIYVHPVCDCYETFEEAKTGLEESRARWGSEEEE